MGIISADRNKVYVTYWREDRNGKFDPKLIETDLTSTICKPTKAFWGSPVNATFGWKEWCEGEDYEYDFSNPIYWRLKEGTKILAVNMKDVTKPSSVLRYIIRDISCGIQQLDFEKMREDNIDAVELMDANIGHLFINKAEMMCNSWDCESIVVLNPSKIIVKNSL